jgi:hypothetical protein
VAFNIGEFGRLIDKFRGLKSLNDNSSDSLAVPKQISSIIA